MKIDKSAISTKTRKQSAPQPKNILIGVRSEPYLGETDPAQFIHSHKTHRTASEAFKDADYATPIWRCETEWDRTVEILKWVMVWVFTLGIFYTFAMGFEKWVSL